MSNFEMPKYHHPDFTQEMFVNAPDAKYEEAEKDGVVPEYYHSTSMYPEYFKINGEWKLAEESRMDSCVILCDDGHLAVVEARNIKKGDKVLLGRTEFKINGEWKLAEESRMDSCVILCDDGHLAVVEARNIKKGDKVLLGRTERCEEGVYMHCHGFEEAGEKLDDQFVFRQGRSRETSYARDYDKLFELLKHEKENGGKIVWVMGPAFAFDANARAAMQALVENGYAHGLLAGNALATHDLEGALLHTALGQDIYTQKSQPNGHYNHLDVLNKVRRSGSIPQFMKDYDLNDGIICSCVNNNVPIVLAG